MIFFDKRVKTVYGAKLYLDELDSLRLRKNKFYEKPETLLIPKLVNKNSIAIDIGAHIGYFTILLSRLCKQVIAFEPEPDNFSILLKNVANNNNWNVNVCRYMISDKNELSNLHVCKTNSGMHRGYESRYCNDTNQVYSIALDTFESLKGKEIDFIKMDIEGMELKAIKGMTDVLRHTKSLIMEYNQESIKEAGDNPEEIIPLLKSLGFMPTVNQVSDKNILLVKV